MANVKVKNFAGQLESYSSRNRDYLKEAEKAREDFHKMRNVHDDKILKIKITK